MCGHYSLFTFAPLTADSIETSFLIHLKSKHKLIAKKNAKMSSYVILKCIFSFFLRVGLAISFTINNRGMQKSCFIWKLDNRLIAYTSTMRPVGKSYYKCHKLK